MVNPKYICISAAVGFVLSFVIGLFSSVAFLHLIIRALIYAAVFAVLSIAINYLSKTFLSSDQSFDSPQSDESSSSSKNSSGNLVNIVVDDSTLRDDSSAPKFSVTNPNIFGDDAFNSEKKQENHSENISSPSLSSPVKNYTDEKTQNPPEAKSYSKSADEKNEPKEKNADSSGFVSADLRSITSGASENAATLENANTASTDGNDDNETKISSGSSENLSDSENDSEAKDGSDDDEIDDLPDIGGIDISSSLSSSDDVIEDTDFATEGTSKSSAASASTEGKDADTMAQAIRTMLAEDK